MRAPKDHAWPSTRPTTKTLPRTSWWCPVAWAPADSSETPASWPGLPAGASKPRSSPPSAPALRLAAAGLLDGYRATTNKRAFSWVREQGPGVDWAAQARWVVNRDRWTSSGVAAGMDMTLALIAQLHGERVARAVANGADPATERPRSKDLLLGCNGHLGAADQRSRFARKCCSASSGRAKSTPAKDRSISSSSAITACSSRAFAPSPLRRLGRIRP